MTEKKGIIVFWVAISSICIILGSQKICPAVQQLVANFDSLPEGFTGSTLTDGGITFSDYNPYLADEVLPLRFYIEALGQQYDAGPYITRPNYLTALSYVAGPGWSFSRFGSANISFETEACQASMLVLYPQGVPVPNNVLELQALLNGEVVASNVLRFTYPPSRPLGSSQLTVSAERFDSLRLVASGPDDTGFVVIGIDNVTIMPTPEPCTLLLLGLGTAAAVRKKR